MSSLLSRVCLLACIFTSTILTVSQAEQNEALKTLTEAAPLESPPSLHTNLRSVEMQLENKLIKPAFLNKRLPASTIAYARLPNIWSGLGSSNGSSLDAAVGSQAFYDATKTIKEGFAQTLLTEIPEDVRLLVELLTKHIDSPLEAALLKTTTEMPPANLLLAASMDFDSADTLRALLQKLSLMSGAQLTKPLDENGFATLKLGDLNIQLSWNNELSLILILTGLDSNPDVFQALVKDLKLNDSNLMQSAEEKVDESGKGAFLWVNPPEIITVAERFGLSSSDLEPFSAIGAKAMKSAALGIGTSGGISHLKFLVDMPMMGLRAVIPSIKSSPTFNLNGKTSLIATLGLPKKSHIIAYETVVSMGSPESMEGYLKFKEGFAKVAGFNLEDIFEFFGQDISVVFGEAGTFFAVRLNDKEAFDDMLSKSIEDFELDYEQREISGHTYHHLQLPNLSIDETLQEYLKGDTNQIAKRLLSVPTHLYWEQEGDYLILANLPQTLMDRHNLKPTIHADEWLRDTQHMDAQGALLMASAVSNGVPASVYRMQLSMLSYLGDITDRPVDLFKLPTPKETKLPKDGTYGLKLTSTDSELAFELAFENNPLEFFGGSTYLSTAVAGVATLIGISVQEEYEKRQNLAKLAPGFATANHVSEILDKYKTEHGKYPDRIAIDALDLELEASTYSLSIEEATGKITITFDVVDYLGGDDIAILEPPTDETPEWTCSSEILYFYLPEFCL